MFKFILLPFIICSTTCDPLRKFFYELLILRPYLDENDHNTNTRIDQSELSSSSQQTYAKNTNNEHFDI